VTTEQGGFDEEETEGCGANGPTRRDLGSIGSGVSQSSECYCGKTE
jgi:hypothetical protein